MYSLACTRKATVPNVFAMRLDRIQPTQLYISAHKLARVRGQFDLLRPGSIDPIPIVRLCGKMAYTDGHTRAFAAFAAGLRQIPVYWDQDELDLPAYEICLRWCERAGIHSIAGLSERIVGPDAYRQLWLDYYSGISQRNA